MLSLNEYIIHHRRAYLFQILLAMLIILIVVIALSGVSESVILGAVGASSLAASTFIAFASPHAPLARFERMIGSYAIAILMGMLFYGLSHIQGLWPENINFETHSQLCAALSVAATMFIMLLINLEHPPAAGLALGIVIDNWNFWMLLVVFLSITIIGLLKVLLDAWLVDLIWKK